jgi:hypothetical protein
MKRTFLILISSITLVFLTDDIFGRQRPIDREAKQKPTGQISLPKADKIGIKPPGQIELKKITPSTTLNIIKSGNFNADDKQFRITACTMSDGNIFIGWEAFADKAGYSYKWRAGRCAKFNTQLRQLGVDMIYTETRNSYFLEDNSSVPFANGNVLVAFNDKIDHQNEKGRYVLLSPQMKILAGPVTFCEGRAASVSATSMLDGDAALIAFSDSKSPTYQGKFIIVNSGGEIITEAKPYTFKGEVTRVSTGTTWNGKAFIGWTDTDDGSLSIEVNVLGNISRGSHAIFNYQTLTGLSVCPLSNRNTLILCNRDGSARALLVGPDGKHIGSFQTFHPQNAFDIQTSLLSGDNVFVSFTTEEEKAMCIMLDSTGKMIKGPVGICEDFNIQPGLDTIAQTKLHNDMVLVITQGYRKEPHNDLITTWTVLK